jgi:hypothetical protein
MLSQSGADLDQDLDNQEPADNVEIIEVPQVVS